MAIRLYALRSVSGAELGLKLHTVSASVTDSMSAVDRAIVSEAHAGNSSGGALLIARYESLREHLIDLLLRHDLLLKREIARSEPRKPDDMLGFAAISRQEIERQLESSLPDATAGVLAIDESLQALQQQIDAKVARSVAHGVRLPIVEIANRFSLDAREIRLLVCCLAVELDRRYERVYGFLHDDMSRKLASPALALGLCCDSIAEQLEMRALLSPQAPLRHYRIIEMAGEGGTVPPTPWQSCAMRIDQRILAFLLGETIVDARVERFMTPTIDNAVSSPKGTRQSIIIEELAKQILHWTGSPHSRKRPLIYLHGHKRAGTDGVVCGVARQLGMEVLAIDCDSIVDGGVESNAFEQTLFLLFREGVLRQSAIFLRNIDRALEAPTGALRYPALLRCLADMGGVVFASGERAWGWQLPAEPVVLRIVELQPDGFAEQLQAWQAMSAGRFEDAQLHRLVSLHPMPVAAISDIWRMARVLAAADGDDSQPTLAQVQQACRAQSGKPAGSLARRIEPKHRWQDLVLPSTQLEQLAALCSQAKHTSIVYGLWRFEGKLSLGRGLNALFSGPPGTGKTMAAEVIAAELGVEMLKIDLSQVVSKYIGETEKNLRQLFDQAASANAILFFDEADALLGKRSDVKDAHDRYANTEIAYLLQKMEEHPGITVLSTNLRQNMDEAFTRRMRFIVEFPFPEDADRLRIWRSVWPQEVPLASDVDLPTLARQFRLSGGSIRNVALSAAFLAAEQQQPVSMRHLMQATKRELQKMGRLVNEEEYRRHA